MTKTAMYSPCSPSELSRSEVNAIHVPSGDHAGRKFPARASPAARGQVLELAALEVQQADVRLAAAVGARLERVGRGRALTYLFSIHTGLRASSIRKTRVCDLRLDGPEPHVSLPRYRATPGGNSGCFRGLFCFSKSSDWYSDGAGTARQWRRFWTP
jgi:hypothetical protein